MEKYTSSDICLSQSHWCVLPTNEIYVRVLIEPNKGRWLYSNVEATEESVKWAEESIGLEALRSFSDPYDEDEYGEPTSALYRATTIVMYDSFVTEHYSEGYSDGDFAKYVLKDDEAYFDEEEE
jgi:hypothetical protein